MSGRRDEPEPEPEPKEPNDDRPPDALAGELDGKLQVVEASWRSERSQSATCCSATSQGIKVSGDEAELTYTIPMLAGGVTSERGVTSTAHTCIEPARCSPRPK